MSLQKSVRCFPALRASLLATLVAFPVWIQADVPTAYTPVQPISQQSKASMLIARQLEYTHFRQQKINPELSSRVFDAYLNYLDEQRSYLLKSDIELFEPYRYRLDGALKTGQLDPAFKIYNAYQARTIERITYVQSLLEQGLDALDMKKDEQLELDRKKSAWTKDQSELNDLWRKRVKNAVLGLRLDGKSDADIITTLKRRYEHQLSRARQVRSEDAFQAWMNAFTGVWDPHTQYFSPRTAENFNINMSLSLEGIGAVLQGDNEYTKVLRLVPGGPASLQGQLKTSDRIVGVAQGTDGEITNVIGWRLDEVVDLIRGPRESTVRLEVIPAGVVDETRTKIVSILRDEVKLEEQAAQKNVFEIERDGQKTKIGVIELPTFYADFKAMQDGDKNYTSTTRDVTNLINQLKEEGVKGLILDLRNNGGGSLEEANAMVGLFIDKGPTVQIRNSDNDVKILVDPDPSVVYNGPLIVLVNRMSASASEIFAGAIQDYGRGIIMGSQTFGKGTVQAVRPLNQGQLKITQSKFYRISGGSTQHQGVIPDIDIPSSIDKTEVGEDALPEALPWDKIPAAEHITYYAFNGILDQLRKRHEQRFDKDQEFSLLKDEIHLLEEQRKRTTISLNEAERRKDQDHVEKLQLNIINQRRQINGETVFENMKAYEAFQEARAGDVDPQHKLDFIAKEAGEVMLDMLALDKQFASIAAAMPAAAGTP